MSEVGARPIVSQVLVTLLKLETLNTNDAAKSMTIHTDI